MDELYTIDRPRQCRFSRKFAVPPREHYALACGQRNSPPLRRYTHSTNNRLRQFELQLRSNTRVQLYVGTKL